MSVFQEKSELHELETNKEVKIKLHYLRKDDNYDGWNVWTWDNNGSKQSVDFFEDTEDSSHGKVATWKVANLDEIDKVGFLIRKREGNNEWAKKDVEEDRFILMKNIDEFGNIHVYVTQGEREVRFKKVKEEAEKDLTVRVHYKRVYNDYKDWNLWAWENDEKGQKIEFTGEDSYGRVAQFNVSKATFDDKLGFIIRKSVHGNEWAEKEGCGNSNNGDNLVSLRKYEKNGKVDIYVMQDEPGIFFERPIWVNFHYKRYNNNYDPWNVWVWKKYKNLIGEPGCGVYFTKDDHAYGKISPNEPGGKIATFMLGNTRGVEKLGFLVRRSDIYGDGKEVWLEWDVDLDRYVDIEKMRELEKDGEVNIYLAQGDVNFAFRKEDMDLSPKILDATIQEPRDKAREKFNTIEVELNTKFNLTDESKADFELRCGNSIIPINNIQYRGIGNDVGRLFKIEIKDTYNLEPFDKKYVLSLKGFKSLPVSIRKLYDEKKFEERLTYDGDDLGVTYSKESSKFRIYAPTADDIELLLYDKGMDSEPVKTFKLKKAEKGTWFGEVKEDLKGMFYKYRVCVEGKEGEIVDIYAKAGGTNLKRGAIVDFDETNPEGWDDVPRPKFVKPTDAVIEELNIRDYTINENSGVDEKYRGRYLGLVQSGTRLDDTNITTVLDHIEEMGYTHIQIMPILKFDGYDENMENQIYYNWGYNNIHFFVLEGSFATDAHNPETRIKEFKKLVMECHKRGIRVIMDVVYNHTFKTQYSDLNILTPKYYHRVWKNSGLFSNATECSNEVASERKMVRKLIVDSVVHLAKEYKVDGFRFDVMYLLDIDTMNAVKEAVHKIDPTILLYGEGWEAEMETPISGDKRAMKKNASKMRGIGFFNNEFGDALKGSFNGSDRAFISNAYHKDREERLKKGIVADIQHADVTNGEDILPTQVLNYAGAHDNLTLYDKICKSVAEATEEVKMKMYKLAYSILFTAQGMVMIPEGDEFMRTKFGNKNSYDAGDEVNAVDWARKSKYKKVCDYIKGLIKLRKAHPAFRMSERSEIQEKVSYFPSLNKGDDRVGYKITDHANGDVSDTLVIVHNGNWQETTVELPGYGWYVLVNGERAGNEVIEEVKGNRVLVPAHSTMVLSDKKSLTMQ